MICTSSLELYNELMNALPDLQVIGLHLRTGANHVLDVQGVLNLNDYYDFAIFRCKLNLLGIFFHYYVLLHLKLHYTQKNSLPMSPSHFSYLHFKRTFFAILTIIFVNRNCRSGTDISQI
jgi:hypothetical protein